MIQVLNYRPSVDIYKFQITRMQQSITKIRSTNTSIIVHVRLCFAAEIIQKLLAPHLTAFREAMIEINHIVLYINVHVPMREKPVVCQHSAASRL